MPSVNIRQLRDTRRLKAWLQAGKTVELRERDRLIARIVPANGDRPSVEMPDFAARAKKIFGDRILNSVDMLIESGDGRAIEHLRGLELLRLALPARPAFSRRRGVSQPNTPVSGSRHFIARSWRTPSHSSFSWKDFRR